MPGHDETMSPPGAASRIRRGRRWWPTSYVWYATIALFALSALVEPASVNSTSLNAMLPFAGILAIAAVGQTLVIMQRGIDLSLPGIMTLSALLVSKAASEGGSLLVAILIVAAVAVAIGVITGCVVSFFNVAPLVATLAMNAVVIGIALAYAGGTPVRAPDALASFALDKTLGVSNTNLLAVVLVVVVAVVIAKTTWGRRFVAVGASERAARTAGIPVDRYRLAAYAAAGLCYAAAGILLAGYVSTPGVTSGDEYLLPAIAAVVVGGTAFSGGRGNIIGTAVAALFLSQLTQLVLSLGAPTATQLIIQAAVIAAAASVQVVDRNALRSVASRLRRPATG